MQNEWTRRRLLQTLGLATLGTSLGGELWGRPVTRTRELRWAPAPTPPPARKITAIVLGAGKLCGHIRPFHPVQQHPDPVRSRACIVHELAGEPPVDRGAVAGHGRQRSGTGRRAGRSGGRGRRAGGRPGGRRDQSPVRRRRHRARANVAPPQGVRARGQTPRRQIRISLEPRRAVRDAGSCRRSIWATRRGTRRTSAACSR